MKYGDIVELEAYDGRIKRRVADFDTKHVYVCNEESFAAAGGGRPEPRVAFRLVDVVNVFPTERGC